MPSTLRIVDYAHGFTGSCHDASAFEHTSAQKYPEWFFKGDEFAFTDSAYPLTARSIPIHKEPANRIPANAKFDKVVSHLRVRSEHCIGALKGRFQCLRGLRVLIRDNEDHIRACRWITIAIILHNVVLDIEGTVSSQRFSFIHGLEQEHEDREIEDIPQNVLIENLDGQEKRNRLIAELSAYNELRRADMEI